MITSRKIVEEASAGALTPMAAAFLNDALLTMLPWLITMLAVIMCDLVAGLRKSLKLGIHISPSRALRATMSKMVTYVAWVLAVSMIDCAVGHSMSVAKWACLLVCAIEGMSIVGNMLKPYGYDFSLKSGILLLLSHVLSKSKDELSDLVEEDHVETIRERERKKWGDVRK